ncbi:hypothetical protein A2U01_0075783, partial [Trifolium medium]|nr:hypothetical protein [Trifolium medium]
KCFPKRITEDVGVAETKVIIPNLILPCLYLRHQFLAGEECVVAAFILYL